MTLRETLIRDAKAFCRKHRISPAHLGSIVADNGRFFSLLESGNDCTTGMYERFRLVFDDPVAWAAARVAASERFQARYRARREKVKRERETGHAAHSDDVRG